MIELRHPFDDDGAITIFMQCEAPTDEIEYGKGIPRGVLV